MTLLDDMRVRLRVSTTATDGEIQGLIDAARTDMERVGVDPSLLALDPTTQDLSNALVKQGIAAYAKAHYGFDNSERAELDAAYRRIVCDLMNSSANIAAGD